jgi:D-tyrosyl-tRNA(Tyr) deacylase
VRRARVLVGDQVAGAIEQGLCVFVGVAEDDGEAKADRLARRVALLRVFENDEGRLDRSLLDVGGAALVVSQFTLLANTAKGHRPSLSGAAPPERAGPLYERFCRALEAEGVVVARGVFGGRMLVEIENDGPVTVLLDS